jgi:threonine dehydrogenase-like Zn-dependent dehydrogenase
MSTETRPPVRTVRAVEWTLESPGRLSRTTTTLPTPTVDEVLVGSVLGALCRGAERALLHGTCPQVSERDYPYQPGSVNVVTIREATDRTLVGERGVARLGHRDFALVPYARFLRIPAGVSDESALLGVVAADAHHAVAMANVESDEDCLVVGGGIVGTLVAWELAHRTKGAIRMVEPDDRRRAVLEGIRFPAEVKVSGRAGRYPFHTVFECANTALAFAAAQEAARAGGSIVVVSDGGHERYVLADRFFARGLFLGKTGPHPDLRAFLNDWFARGEDRSGLERAAFGETLRFDEFPQAYIKTALAAPGEAPGLLPRVIYPD